MIVNFLFPDAGVCIAHRCLKGFLYWLFNNAYQTWKSIIKGTVSQDESWISFPQAPDYTIRAVSNFFLKFAEIFAAQGAPLVLLTPVANGKNLQPEKFSLFLLDTFG